MDTLGRPDQPKGSSNSVLRMIKTRILNIIVIIVIIVCIILFMREQGQADKEMRMINVEDTSNQAGVRIMEQMDDDIEAKSMDTTTGMSMDNMQELENELKNRHKDNNPTTTEEIATTTPYFTTVPAKVNLQQDSEKEAIHIDYLKIGSYEVGNLKLDFLDNYRNPCFFEEREETNIIHVGITYRYNPYRNLDRFADKFETLRKMVVRSHEDLCGSSAGCRLRCIPYFMVVGTAQSETIEFFDTLSLHKQITPPIVQELSFWDKYRFNDANFNDYLDLFDNASRVIHQQNITDPNTNENIYMSVTGEASSIYMLTDPNWRLDQRNEELDEPAYLLARDLHNVIPNLKFIFLLREPVAHMYWHYNNAPYGRDQKSPEDFNSRVKKSIEWWNLCTKSNPERACIYGSPPDMDQFENRDENNWWPKTENYLGTLRDVLYWYYVKDYFKVFPKENFLFIRADDYLADPRLVLNDKVYPFLDLSPFKESFHISETATNLDKNTTKEYKPMLSETRQLLMEFIAPFNVKLAELLHDNRFLWKDITEPDYKPNAKCCG